jgi:nitrite transporter NirC
MLTYIESVRSFARTAKAKKDMLRTNPIGFFVLAIMAGSYVGLGILLMLSVGQGVDSSVQPIVMGVSFGVALILVVFAGSELFTGHTMYMTHGFLCRNTSIKDLLLCWFATWSGNLIGAFLLGILFVCAGGGPVLHAEDDLVLYKIAGKKMHRGDFQLFLNGILCNWLVCLSIWCGLRSQNHVAQILIIWFCLYAFIAAGFEHSVANMTVFSVALLAEHHPDSLTIIDAFRNLLLVTSGNIVAGVVFMGLGYWLAAGKPLDV